jgi:hypothetical protein
MKSYFDSHFARRPPNHPTTTTKDLSNTTIYPHVYTKQLSITSPLSWPAGRQKWDDIVIYDDDTLICIF